jgi:hypothetical protein
MGGRWRRCDCWQLSGTLKSHWKKTGFGSGYADSRTGGDQGANNYSLASQLVEAHFMCLYASDNYGKAQL